MTFPLCSIALIGNNTNLPHGCFSATFVLEHTDPVLPIFVACEGTMVFIRVSGERLYANTNIIH